MIEVCGWEVIDVIIVVVQNMFFGYVFCFVGEVDVYYDIVCFYWYLVEFGVDELLVIGFDVVVLDNGCICQVYGFFDKVLVVV